MTTVKYKVHFGRVLKPMRNTRDWKKVKRVEKTEPAPAESTDKRASAAQLLALAYFVERGLADGSILDFAEAVAMVGISQSRLSQIMKLLDLKPEIQEAVLLGENRVAERGLRRAAGRPDWAEQGQPLIAATSRPWASAIASTFSMPPSRTRRLADHP